MDKKSIREKRVSIGKFLAMSVSILGLFVIFTVLSPQIKAQAYIYEHSNYEGRSKVIRQDTPWVGNDFNDTLSSLTVPAGWEVILYEHSNYQGRSKIFQQNTAFVGNDFNDIASSIKIRQLSVNVNFRNQTNHPVSIYWVNEREEFYNNLQGNTSYSQQTYVTHRWRLKLKGKVLGDYTAQNLSSQTVSIIAENIESGPIWDQKDAERKCNNLANSRNSVWTGEWRTTETGRMSVCELARLVIN